MCVILLKVIFLFNSFTGAGKSISTPQDLFRSSGKALMKRQHWWGDLLSQNTFKNFQKIRNINIMVAYLGHYVVCVY